MKHLGIIQQVHISNEITLYITKCNLETKSLTYRLSTMPKLEMEETFTIKDSDKVALPLYYFSLGYLNRFLHLNEQI